MLNLHALIQKNFNENFLIFDEFKVYFVFSIMPISLKNDPVNYFLLLANKWQIFTLMLQSQLALANAAPSGDTWTDVTRFSWAYKIATRILFRVSHTFMQ